MHCQHQSKNEEVVYNIGTEDCPKEKYQKGPGLLFRGNIATVLYTTESGSASIPGQSLPYTQPARVSEMTLYLHNNLPSAAYIMYTGINFASA